MKIFGWEVRARKTESKTLTDQYWQGWFGGEGYAGKHVTEANAMQTVTVFACVRILAESVAGLPLIVYRRRGDGKERASAHSLYRLLHDTPNPEMTSFEFRETLTGHLCLWGNAYAEIERDNAGRVLALWPLRPDRMHLKHEGSGLAYSYNLGAGGFVRLAPESVLHLRGLSGDGLIGMSPIRQAKEAIGLSAAMEEFGARLFGQGGRPLGVLEHPGRLSEQGEKLLRESWQKEHGGLSNAHRVAILQEGMAWKPIGIPPDEAQFLDSRRYQVSEIARMYRIPLHLLGAEDKASTYASVEQFAIQFVVHTLRPWLVRWEQAIKRALIPETDYFAEFLLDGLLRGDSVSRYQAYATGRQWGWLSADDIRRLENMNPLPDGQGQSYLVPMNMVDAGAGPPEVRSVRGRDLPARAKRPDQFLPAIRAAMERLVTWETSEIRKMVKRNFGQRDAPALVLDVEEWYKQDATKQRMRRYVQPIYQTIARTIRDDLEAEIGKKLPADWSVERELGGCKYTRIFVKEHAATSVATVRKWMRASFPEEACEEGLEDWEKGRAARISQIEAVKSCNVYARVGMAMLGVLAYVWATTSVKPCPYCQVLDGRRVGMQETFAAGELMPEGHSPMRMQGILRQPPLHEACHCVILPG